MAFSDSKQAPTYQNILLTIVNDGPNQVYKRLTWSKLYGAAFSKFTNYQL